MVSMVATPFLSCSGGNSILGRADVSGVTIGAISKMVRTTLVASVALIAYLHAIFGLRSIP
jgi:hypothetical protein